MAIEDTLVKLVEAGYSPTLKKTELKDPADQYFATCAGSYDFYYAPTLEAAVEKLYQAIKDTIAKQVEALK